MIVLLLSTLALADIPPPEGYVESCTVKKVQAANSGQACVSCDGWHGGREDCEALEAQGYTLNCRTAGASVWTEVHCRAADAPPTPDPRIQQADAPVDEPKVTPEPEPGKVEPKPAKKKDCSTAAGGGGTAAFALAMLALLGRRRR